MERAMSPRAIGTTTTAVVATIFLTSVTHAQIRPAAPSSPINLIANMLPMGVSVQYAPAGAASAIALGPAAAFQLQETVPYMVSNAPGSALQGGAPQLSGSISFPANDQQATLLNTCLASRCSATVTISNVGSQGATTFNLGGANFTGGGLTANGLNATFAFQKIVWQASGAAAQLQAVVPNSSTIQSAGAPAGVSVTFLAPPGAVGGTSASATASLGMAAGFQLQPIPAAGAGPATGAGSGAIQFPTGAQQPIQMSSCLLALCATTVTITNATAQGITVYTLSNARLTSLAVGQTTSVSFLYSQIQWWSFAPGVTTASQMGGWNYATGQAIK
jgi:hypothetical protein